jgi:hypothetical protein
MKKSLILGGLVSLVLPVFGEDTVFDDLPEFIFNRGDYNKFYETATRNDTEDYFSDRELKIISVLSLKRNIDPFLMMAIRRSEDASPGLEFGVKKGTPGYSTDWGYTFGNFDVFYSDDSVNVPNYAFERQAAWCAATIQKNLKRFDNCDKNSYEDFIDFFGDNYCPEDDLEDTLTNLT